MDKQNITLSIRKDILQKIKIIAVKRDTSVSGMLTQVLKDIVSQDEGYRQAYKNHSRILKEGLSMNTYGSAHWSLDDLHDR